MRAGGFVLGGEQSGHIIALDHATTGDGTLTALLLAERVVRSGKPLAESGFSGDFAFREPSSTSPM